MDNRKRTAYLIAMRKVAWLAIMGLAWVGCSKPDTSAAKKSQTKPKPPTQSADERALEILGGKIYAAFVSGKSSELKPLTLWGVPEPKLDHAMQAVFIADAETVMFSGAKSVPYSPFMYSVSACRSSGDPELA